jgi:hypothetical protein
METPQLPRRSDGAAAIAEKRAAKLTEEARRLRDADELPASLAVLSQSTNGPVHD